MPCTPSCSPRRTSTLRSETCRTNGQSTRATSELSDGRAAEAEVLDFLEHDAARRQAMERRASEQEWLWLTEKERGARDTMETIESHRRRGITKRFKSGRRQLLGILASSSFTSYNSSVLQSCILGEVETDGDTNTTNLQSHSLAALKTSLLTNHTPKHGDPDPASITEAAAYGAASAPSALPLLPLSLPSPAVVSATRCNTDGGKSMEAPVGDEWEVSNDDRSFSPRLKMLLQDGIRREVALQASLVDLRIRASEQDPLARASRQILHSTPPPREPQDVDAQAAGSVDLCVRGYGTVPACSGEPSDPSPYSEVPQRGHSLHSHANTQERDLPFLGPVHEAIRSQWHTGSGPRDAGEAFACYNERELSVWSGWVHSLRESTDLPGSHRQSGLDYSYSRADPRVLQRLWVSTVIRQQLLLLLSALLWAVVLLPQALEVALPSQTTSGSSSAFSQQYWSSGVNSGRLLLFTAQTTASFLTLLLLIACGGGLCVLRRPLVVLALLFIGAWAVAGGFAALYAGFRLQSFWWPLCGKLAIGVGVVLTVGGLIGLTAAEVGITAGVTLQMQLGLLLWPFTLLVSVTSVPFATTYVISEEDLFQLAVELVWVGAVLLPLLLTALVPPSVLQEAVPQHNLLAATSDVTQRRTLLRLSPQFFLRILTASTVFAAATILFLTAPAVLAQPYKSSLTNPFTAVTVLCLAEVLLWPWCFIPLLVHVVRDWLSCFLCVLVLAGSWVLYFELRIVSPLLLAAITGVSLMSTSSSVVRSLVNLGTSWIPDSDDTETVGSPTPSSLAKERTNEGTPMLNEALTEAGSGGHTTIRTSGSVLVSSKVHRCSGGIPGNPFAVMVLGGVCGCLALGLTAVASAVAYALLRDAEELSSSGRKTLVPGVSLDANRALLKVISGLCGLAVLAQVLEIIARGSQWSHLSPST